MMFMALCFLEVYLIGRLAGKQSWILRNGLDKWAVISPMLDHSKITKMPFSMIQTAKNEAFGHFLEFGAFDLLDIAYSNRTKWFACIGQCISHAWSF